MRRRTEAGRAKRVCPQCGLIFQPPWRDHKNYAQRFCSQACANANVTERKRANWPAEDEMRRLVNVERLSDAVIGSMFGYSYEWARRIRNHYRIPAVPKPPHREVKHGRYSGQGGWTVKAKGEVVCRACGAAPSGAGPMGALHLHHVIPRSMCKGTALDLRNGIALCRDCHGGWHDRRVTIYRDVFTADEWAFLTSVELLGQRTIAWLDDHYPVRREYGMAAA